MVRPLDSVHPLHSVHAMHSVGALSSEHPTHRYGGGTCPVGKLVGAPIERGFASAYLAQRLLAHDRPAGIQICSRSSTLRGQHGGRMPRLLVESSLEHAHLMREAIERSSEAIKRSSESSLEHAHQHVSFMMREAISMQSLKEAHHHVSFLPAPLERRLKRHLVGRHRGGAQLAECCVALPPRLNEGPLSMLGTGHARLLGR